MAEATGVAVGYAELATLKELALRGGLEGRAKVSCAGLSEDLEVSNQTVSRRLRDLEDAGLVERDIASDGQAVTVTAAGERRLQGEYADYRRLFDPGAGLDLTGTVTSGMGEGRHYISLDGYMEQFRDRLGYEPFPGTLNVALDEESTRTRARMEAFDPVPIDGWEDEDRTYGPAVCYPAEIETADGETYSRTHIITPERTHHDEDQLELIAPDRLRDELGLDDGDYLNVHVNEQ